MCHLSRVHGGFIAIIRRHLDNFYPVVTLFAANGQVSEVGGGGGGGGQGGSREGRGEVRWRCDLCTAAAVIVALLFHMNHSAYIHHSVRRPWQRCDKHSIYRQRAEQVLKHHIQCMIYAVITQSLPMAANLVWFFLF